ncbi:hypothetical protein DFH28DRAFT_1125525 [Melampsora americana]|nr:hypothetical protein DFH28DRAFT_1125525 [Melampsora americana]
MSTNESSTSTLASDTNPQSRSKTDLPIFKKKSKKININKRERVSERIEEEIPNKSLTSNSSQPIEIVKSSKKTKRKNLNPLFQSTGSSYKKRKTSDDESTDESDESEDEDEEIKKRGGIAYQAQGSARQQARQEILSTELKNSNQLKSIGKNDLPPDEDDGLYHGASSLKHQLPKGSAKYGPIKGGPENVRTITIVDYQPDVCKDYKDTGFCGFGDTCKFLHDRSDYMHGWQLDDAFAGSRKKGDQQDDEDDEEEVPFACLICREPFTDPIVTKCQHYFCSSCAIKRFAKTPKCFACGAPTSGIFNKAAKIIERMKAKQERLKAEKEAKRLEETGLDGIEGLEEAPEEDEGSERSFYEDE